MRHLEKSFRVRDHASRIDSLATLQQLRAQIDAQEQYVLHVLASEGVGTELDKDWVREEVACQLRVPDGTAQERLDLAGDLVVRLPQTLDALARGELTLQHARRLVEAVRPLPDDAASRVEAEVLAGASSQTVAQFAQRVRRAVLRADPAAAEERHRRAHADRRVVITPVEDGMAELWALLPADGALRLQQRLDECVRATAGDDDRTADQRRADALCELGDAGSTTSVQVTVALSTLLGVDDAPGELNRHGPVPAALARALADDPDGTWRRLLTDDRGRLLDVGRRTYRPPAHIARHVRTAHPTCAFPGCRRASERCELDHIVAWEDGGATSTDNLQPACPRHHHLKHEAGWGVWRLPDGTTRWRSPAGYLHDRPPDPLPIDRTCTAPPPF